MVFPRRALAPPERLVVAVRWVYRPSMGYGLPDGPWGGLVVVALVTLGSSAVLGSILYQHEIARVFGRLVRRVAPPPEPPSGPPIERIAQDARRLRAELATLASGTPMARRRGLSRAYDDLLVDACRALGVPDTLSGMAPGPDRDSERRRVEYELEEVGLRLTA